jgi:catechol 2,3-dioxygenase-like lactoylglutathione lyase family enzyme
MKEEAVVNQRKSPSGSAFQAIRAIDYTVIFVRDMAAMRRFYEDILGFPLLRELSPGWIEYRVGDNTLALARPGLTAADVPTPNGSASLQLAFKVSAPEVDQCAAELVRQGVNSQQADLLTDTELGRYLFVRRKPTR